MRTIITHFLRPTTLPCISLSQLSKNPTAENLSFLFPLKPSKPKTLAKPYATLNPNPNPNPKPKPSLILNSKDQRFLDSTLQNENSSSTIAAIVTSIGGPPAAVGIVRLSGPSAVDVAARVFKPLRKKKKKLNLKSEGLCAWRPTSHVVDYGVVLDPLGSVIDEV